jgi:hypothetical protein
MDKPPPDTPGMIGPSPSERGLPAVPADPAEHALRSASEWADVAETYVRRLMKELGIPEEMIGSSDHKRGGERHAFFPNEMDGGGVAPGRRLNVDSGILNPELHPIKEWADETLRRRIDATIAHEFEEAVGGTHEYAVQHASETDLPVGGLVRKLLRAIRLSEQGFPGDPASRTR